MARNKIVQQEEEINDKTADTPSPAEQEYAQRLWSRMLAARDERDAPSEHWDGKTFLQSLQDNDEAFNSTLEPRKNSADWRSKTRKQTTHKKVMAVAASVMEQNLEPLVQAFNEDDQELTDLSRALTSAVKRTNEIEQDEELRFNILIELCKQGTVFVEENYEVIDREIKELEPIDWVIGATLDKVAKFKTRVVKEKRDCEKSILKPNQVYLGDIRQISMNKQPFIFVKRILTYQEAKAKYGKWTKWDKVQSGGMKTASLEDVSAWTDVRLSSLGDNEVEEIRYQSMPDDEYQIILNGVMMLPMGFPLPWAHKRYNVVKRILFPINPFFAYGHGIVHKLKADRETLDSLVRLVIDKGRQSLLPPLVSLSKRILSKEIFMPGKVTYDLNPDQTKPLFQNQQIGSSEFSLIQMLEASIDETSVSKTFTGSDSTNKNTTATEVVAQQKEAIKLLGLVVFAYSWLLRDLSWLRVQNIIENYGKPMEETVNDKEEIRKIYRVLALNNENLRDGSVGTRIVNFAPVSEHPAPETLYREEQNTRKAGKPVERIYIDTAFIRTGLRHKFFIITEPSEKKTSDLKKIMFKEFVEGVVAWFPFADMQYLARRYSEIWGETPEKVFPQNQMGPAPALDVSKLGGKAPGGSQVASQMKFPSRPNLGEVTNPQNAGQ